MVTDTDPGSERPGAPSDWVPPWVLVLLALACWIAPPVIVTLVSSSVEEENPENAGALGLLFLIAWLLVFVPVGVGLMVAAWVAHRRTRQRALAEPAGRPDQRPRVGCLASAVPLAVIGVLTVSMWAFTRDWRPGLLAASPSVAAVVVAVRDRYAARRSGKPQSWDLLGIGIGVVTLAWWVAVVLGARWPAGWDLP